MTPIGEAAGRTTPAEALAEARGNAAHLPDLLVDARRVANTVIAGWHGRRKRGIGENFWQFRSYVEGETLARIDWRRSARDDHLYVRDREWEAAHTVWLWADPSPSMLFRSRAAMASKQERALILVLAVAELLSRSGERIGWPGLTDPFAARNGAERLAARLAAAPSQPARPDWRQVRRGADLVLASDFLDTPQETAAWLDPLARLGARVHLVEIADPAEEEFPYAGRTEFRDPESDLRLTAGRAEAVAAGYRALYQARRQELMARCARLGWSYSISRTDRPASTALARLHTMLTAEAGPAAGAAP